MLFHFIEYGEKTPQKKLHRAVTAGKDPALRPDAVFCFRVFLLSNTKRTACKKNSVQKNRYTGFSQRECPVTFQTGTKFGAFLRAFREKPEFYGENPIAQRVGMGFSQVTIHALDRACTVTMSKLSRYYDAFFEAKML